MPIGDYSVVYVNVVSAVVQPYCTRTCTPRALTLLATPNLDSSPAYPGQGMGAICVCTVHVHRHYSIKLNLDIHSPSKSPSPEKEEEGEGESGEEGEEGDGELPYHTIVIDCAPIGFADSMGITVLEQVNVKKKRSSGTSENLMVH